MTWRKKMTAFVERDLAEAEAKAAQPGADTAALTSHQELQRAADSGQFEALVRKARLAQPVAMVTPQEREAELRASGRWPAEGPDSKQAPGPVPQPEPEPEPGPGSPDSPYVREHCHWRPPDSYDEHDYRPPPRGVLISDYDPLAEFDED